MMGAGLRPSGKLLDWPPYPKMQSAPHFYPDRRGDFPVIAFDYLGFQFRARKMMWRKGEKRIYTGGENSIAVFAINQTTGEPTLIQSADTHGIGPRTFAIDPSGKILIAINIVELIVRDGGNERLVKPNLAVFRVGADGKLAFVSTYDAPGDTGGQPLNQPWVSIASLP